VFIHGLNSRWAKLILTEANRTGLDWIGWECRRTNLTHLAHTQSPATELGLLFCLFRGRCWQLKYAQDPQDSPGLPRIPKTGSPANSVLTFRVLGGKKKRKTSYKRWDRICKSARLGPISISIPISISRRVHAVSGLWSWNSITQNSHTFAPRN